MPQRFKKDPCRSFQFNLGQLWTTDDQVKMVRDAAVWHEIFVRVGHSFQPSRCDDFEKYRQIKIVRCSPNHTTQGDRNSRKTKRKNNIVATYWSRNEIEKY